MIAVNVMVKIAMKVREKEQKTGSNEANKRLNLFVTILSIYCPELSNKLAQTIHGM